MRIRKSILGIVWENMTPGTELPRDFCAGIGPLQLGVVLVCLCFTCALSIHDIVSVVKPEQNVISRLHLSVNTGV